MRRPCARCKKVLETDQFRLCPNCGFGVYDPQEAKEQFGSTASRVAAELTPWLEEMMSDLKTKVTITWLVATVMEGIMTIKAKGSK